MCRIIEKICVFTSIIVFVFLQGCSSGQISETEYNPEKSLQSVVELYCVDNDTVKKETFGSGVVLCSDESTGCYIATCYHVICDYVHSGRITVSLFGATSDSRAEANVVYSFPEYDISLLYAKNFSEKFSGVKPINFSIGEERVGDDIFAIGNAYGKGLSITEGIISIKRERVSIGVGYRPENVIMNLTRINASLNTGCSGGGCFDENGEFIGLINARNISSGIVGVGYVIPSGTVKILTDKAMKYIKEKIGVYMVDFGAEISERNTRYVEKEGRFEAEKDLIVEKTEKGTVSDMYFKKGDIIKKITINGSTYLLTNRYLFEEKLLSLDKNDNVSISFTRDNETKTCTFSVTESYMVSLGEKA